MYTVQSGVQTTLFTITIDAFCDRHRPYNFKFWMKLYELSLINNDAKTG